MITLNVGSFLAAFIAAMGIPSAIMGVIVWKLERRISKQEKTAEDRENSREELLLLVVQSTGAAIALGELQPRRCNVSLMHIATETCTRRWTMQRRSSTSKRTFCQSRGFTPFGTIKNAMEAVIGLVNTILKD